MMSWEERAPEGVYPIEGANAFFLEPSRIISSNYFYFSAIPHRYYSRSFFLPHQPQRADHLQASNVQQKKRKRKKLSAYALNPKELLAQRRHQDVRKFILDAHTAFMALPEVSSFLKSLEKHLYECKENQHFSYSECKQDTVSEMIDFVELGTVWQASLYSMTLSMVNATNEDCNGSTQESAEPLIKFPLFRHMIENNTDKELLGSCAGITTILPKKSRFLMSDLADIRQTLSSYTGNGYNLIIIDPPWENRSAHRHAVYSTVPNKHLLFLPLKELAHPQGALIGLWVTNREKLRAFVEDVLFPAWDVDIQATWFWLKINADGCMIGELDTPHHKPYECLLLGYMRPQGNKSDSQIPVLKFPPDKQVLISIPGDHSRKPPLDSLLSAYVPGQDSVRGLELFARDIHPGWTSWGNEPLRFQQMHYFEKE
ncbi:hypothetical protein GOP47_0008625 [Adiantum capillus-veneris]|uniref:Methyltransferase-like protein 2 n=1 Tax=Adiantum capillus-veneris TaxID=13818 RepID=A0A9D4UYQ1_ADICA|nr:hypothetical protein GOP47_0008625 [Adiantum capillus-veneris]